MAVGKPIYARITRAVPVSSGIVHYCAVTESGRKQTIYIRAGVLLNEGDHVRVQEDRGGEWRLV